MYLGVIGAGQCSREIDRMAEQVGREIARAKAVLICGGRGGVMEAAARGAARSGGTVIGILPGSDRREANPFLSYSIVTGLGPARNALIIRSCEAVIAVAGGAGTLSEIGLAMKMEVPVVGLRTWQLDHPEHKQTGIVYVEDPGEAVQTAVRLARRRNGKE